MSTIEIEYSVPCGLLARAEEVEHALLALAITARKASAAGACRIDRTPPARDGAGPRVSTR